MEKADIVLIGEQVLRMREAAAKEEIDLLEIFTKIADKVEKKPSLLSKLKKYL